MNVNVNDRDNDMKGVIQLLQAVPAMRDLQEMFEDSEQAEHARKCEQTLVDDAMNQLKGLAAPVAS